MTRVLHWNGRDLPPELAALPPGDYVILPAGEGDLPADEQEVLAERLVAAERGEAVELPDLVARAAARLRSGG